MTSISLAEYKKINKPKRRAKRPASVKTERVVSEGEAVLSQHLRAHKIKFEQEFQFNADRKWRADFHLIGMGIFLRLVWLLLLLLLIWLFLRLIWLLLLLIFLLLILISHFTEPHKIRINLH